MMHYPVRYKIEFGEFTKADLIDGDFGGCDAVIIHSLAYPPDGQRSEIIFSKDGRTRKPLHVDELYNSWSLMAYQLKDDEELGYGRRLLAGMLFELHRALIIRDRAMTDEHVREVLRASIQSLKNVVSDLEKSMKTGAP